MLYKENSQTNLSIKKQNSTKACRQHKLAQGEKAKSGKQHAIPTGGKKNKAGKGKKKLADAARGGTAGKLTLRRGDRQFPYDSASEKQKPANPGTLSGIESEKVKERIYSFHFNHY